VHHRGRCRDELGKCVHVGEGRGDARVVGVELRAPFVDGREREVVRLEPCA
jgi:hypothetical protein